MRLFRVSSKSLDLLRLLTSNRQREDLWAWVDVEDISPLTWKIKIARIVIGILRMSLKNASLILVTFALLITYGNRKDNSTFSSCKVLRNNYNIKEDVFVDRFEKFRGTSSISLREFAMSHFRVRLPTEFSKLLKVHFHLKLTFSLLFLATSDSESVLSDERFVNYKNNVWRSLRMSRTFFVSRRFCCELESWNYRILRIMNYES